MGETELRIPTYNKHIIKLKVNEPGWTKNSNAHVPTTTVTHTHERIPSLIRCWSWLIDKITSEWIQRMLEWVLMTTLSSAIDQAAGTTTQYHTQPHYHDSIKETYIYHIIPEHYVRCTSICIWGYWLELTEGSNPRGPNPTIYQNRRLIRPSCMTLGCSIYLYFL